MLEELRKIQKILKFYADKSTITSNIYWDRGQQAQEAIDIIDGMVDYNVMSLSV